MDYSLFSEYLIPLIVFICMGVGYLIKNSLDFIDNKYIPLIVVIVGIVLSVFTKRELSLDTVLAGIVSGLASTGMHQTCKCLKKK